MIVSHYTAIVIISSISLLAFAIGVHTNKFMLRHSRTWFQVLFMILIILNLSEWGAAKLDGYMDLVQLRIALKFIEFTVAPLTGLVCILAIGDKKSLNPAFGAVICNFFLQIISIFNGMIFFIGDNGVYRRGFLYPLYIFLALVSVLFAFISVRRYSKSYQAQNTVLFVTISIMVLLAILAQMILSYLKLDWVFISFVVMILYLYLDQIQQQVDPLTGLLNRRTFQNYRREDLIPDAAIIFFDIDNFKNINDTYGHAVGDECLKLAAQEIKKVFSKYGYCFRYGGDEFCVLINKKYAKLDSLIEQFNADVSTMTFNDGLSFPKISYGNDVFREGKSIGEVVNNADAIMYENKRAKQENCTFKSK